MGGTGGCWAEGASAFCAGGLRRLELSELVLADVETACPLALAFWVAQGGAEVRVRAFLDLLRALGESFLLGDDIRETVRFGSDCKGTTSSSLLSIKEGAL